MSTSGGDEFGTENDVVAQVIYAGEKTFQHQRGPLRLQGKVARVVGQIDALADVKGHTSPRSARVTSARNRGKITRVWPGGRGLGKACGIRHSVISYQSSVVQINVRRFFRRI